MDKSLEHLLPVVDAQLDPSLVAAAVFIAILLWYFRRALTKGVGLRRVREPSVDNTDLRIADPFWQKQFVSAVEFEPQPLLNRSEFQVLVLLEAVARDLNAGFRVMAQTSLGEILRPKRTWRRMDSDLAYRSINSKRSDFVVVDRFGIAVLAVEYQGRGHYQGNAVQRDAVKREAFRSAKVAFLEIPMDFDGSEVGRTVRHILQRHAAGNSIKTRESGLL